jgi:hypothetical protein
VALLESAVTGFEERHDLGGVKPQRERGVGNSLAEAEAPLVCNLRVEDLLNEHTEAVSKTAARIRASRGLCSVPTLTH